VCAGVQEGRQARGAEESAGPAARGEPAAEAISEGESQKCQGPHAIVEGQARHLSSQEKSPEAR
jgi:hypothetical protein